MNLFNPLLVRMVSKFTTTILKFLMKNGKAWLSLTFGCSYVKNKITVGVAQRLEHQVVVLGAEGSRPFTHPKYIRYKIKNGRKKPEKMRILR